MGIPFEFVLKETIEDIILLGGIGTYQVTIFDAKRREKTESIS